MSSEQYCIKVGNRIKTARKDKGITLKELGEKIGLTEATIQKYESGNIKNIDVELLKRMATVLEVDPALLAAWEDDYKTSPSDKESMGKQYGEIIKIYSQLTPGHKMAVLNLMKDLLDCQEK